MRQTADHNHEVIITDIVRRPEQLSPRVHRHGITRMVSRRNVQVAQTRAGVSLVFAGSGSDAGRKGLHGHSTTHPGVGVVLRMNDFILAPVRRIGRPIHYIDTTVDGGDHMTNDTRAIHARKAVGVISDRCGLLQPVNTDARE